MFILSESLHIIDTLIEFRINTISLKKMAGNEKTFFLN